ncbi:MAG: hypothetical protein A2534_04295 [Candidatus Magasanikbacteria bacterium RIFOXYD2_FULL_39_9]|uniref:Uncharacterized protein n=1 Tax=Candidatus Magasanikbacteria bacterium RIFOXYD1_FULL_40_23 TaxID=1798705 RepID=A0A1F6PBB5_9BACT|nr:MAG: hypothetical protein A2534_04295 [Candidatus Magasanikbacteria bacterium RIFOXYD2_FULL_39_9]OGH93408.1 MAG: hypothetical protein A2563_02255 [Candidatus Magasanikbacteria bacterium RIFOXYD1_FULL_40_23]
MEFLPSVCRLGKDDSDRLVLTSSELVTNRSAIGDDADVVVVTSLHPLAELYLAGKSSALGHGVEAVGFVLPVEHLDFPGDRLFEAERDGLLVGGGVDEHHDGEDVLDLGGVRLGAVGATNEASQKQDVENERGAHDFPLVRI